MSFVKFFVRAFYRKRPDGCSSTSTGTHLSRQKWSYFEKKKFVSWRCRKVMIKRDRSSPPEVFLGKGVLNICSKFTGERPIRSVIIFSEHPWRAASGENAGECIDCLLLSGTILDCSYSEDVGFNVALNFGLGLVHSQSFKLCFLKSLRKKN